jgi:hypothetical protein
MIQACDADKDGKLSEAEMAPLRELLKEMDQRRSKGK